MNLKQKIITNKLNKYFLEYVNTLPEDVNTLPCESFSYYNLNEFYFDPNNPTSQTL